MSFNSYKPFKKRSLLPKYLIVFLLGISFALFFSSALNIVTGIENATQYIKQIILTSDGTVSGTTGIVLDGVNGRIGIGVDTPNNLIQVKDLINFSSGNTAIGYISLQNNTLGLYNTAIGYASLQSNTDGNNNTAVGDSAGYESKGDGNVFLGYKAGYTENGNNKLHIANTGTKTLIYGEFDNNTVEINNILKLTPIELSLIGGASCSGFYATGSIIFATDAAGGSQLCFCNGDFRKPVADPTGVSNCQ